MKGRDILDVLAAVVPLYVAMIVAYASVRWWRVFTAEQCSGINRFVAVFAVPLLSFHFISTNNPYAMNYHFIAADSLQKLLVLTALSLWHRLGSRRLITCSLDWSITLFSLSTLPNTLVMGIPLLRAMYGDFSGSLMVQIVVLQSVVWYTLMLFLFEYRAAKALIADQFPPDIAASIASFRVHSDVVSLSNNVPLQADADVAPDGRLHVSVRRSLSTNNRVPLHSLPSNMTPRASNLTGVEIYSLQSSREPTPRASSFNQSDFYAMFGALRDDEELGVKFGKHAGTGSRCSDSSASRSAPPAANATAPSSSKELHMYVWSASSASPVSEANLRNAVNRAASADLGSCPETSKTGLPVPKFPSLRGSQMGSENASPMRKGQAEIEDAVSRSPGIKLPIILTVPSPYGGKTKKIAGEGGGLQVEGTQQMPPASVMTRLILIMVWRKLIRNPNTYSSLIGLIWSLVSFRWNIEMPAIIKGSISILSDAGLGMAMFSLGLFMALQPKIIACGKSIAVFSMAIRFLAGPAAIAAASLAVGVRGVLLHVAIVQAALPQGIVPFVFAKEYNCHPDILSTAVIFGMLIALPITILYYVLLGV